MGAANCNNSYDSAPTPSHTFTISTRKPRICAFFVSSINRRCVGDEHVKHVGIGGGSDTVCNTRPYL